MTVAEATAVYRPHWTEDERRRIAEQVFGNTSRALLRRMMLNDKPRIRGRATGSQGPLGEERIDTTWQRA